MGPLSRRLRALERRIGPRDFNSGGPPLDEDGLPDWTGTGLPVESYSRLLDGDVPDAELTPQELETRNRLAPFASVFERLQRDEEAGGEAVK